VPAIIDEDDDDDDDGMEWMDGWMDGWMDETATFSVC